MITGINETHLFYIFQHFDNLVNTFFVYKSAFGTKKC